MRTQKSQIFNNALEILRSYGNDRARLKPALLDYAVANRSELTIESQDGEFVVAVEGVVIEHYKTKRAAEFFANNLKRNYA